MLASADRWQSAGMADFDHASSQHFVTAALDDECSIASTEHMGLLHMAFRACRERYPFSLTAGVILPNHLHFIAALAAGECCE